MLKVSIVLCTMEVTCSWHLTLKVIIFYSWLSMKEICTYRRERKLQVKLTVTFSQPNLVTSLLQKLVNQTWRQKLWVNIVIIKNLLSKFDDTEAWKQTSANWNCSKNKQTKKHRPNLWILLFGKDFCSDSEHITFLPL